MANAMGMLPSIVMKRMVAMRKKTVPQIPMVRMYVASLSMKARNILVVLKATEVLGAITTIIMVSPARAMMARSTASMARVRVLLPVIATTMGNLSKRTVRRIRMAERRVVNLSIRVASSTGALSLVVRRTIVAA